VAAVVAVEPVLVVVDDVNWLDRASAAVLAYVARRLAGTRIALIAVMRSGERTPFEGGGLDTYELQRLSDAEAATLLQARFPSLTLHARGRLLSDAQGNPLALLELPIALSTRGATSAVLPRVLPLTQRLERLFGGRIEHLPGATRDFLLLAVLDGTGDLGVLGQLAFHHPLVRSAIIQRSTSGERRGAHQVLAERRRDDPERLAWQLAEAAVEPDEHVASLRDTNAVAS
jgi:hypothetical protein